MLEIFIPGIIGATTLGVAGLMDVLRAAGIVRYARDDEQ